MRQLASTLCLLLVTLALAAQARAWHVERDGTSDFTTIQPAVDAAAPGDTIFIGPGEYTEYQTIPLTGTYLIIDAYVYVQTRDLTFIGAGNESVIIGAIMQDFQQEGPKGFFIDGAIEEATLRPSDRHIHG